MPNMTVMAPKNRYELMDMLDFAVDFKGPIAIKYPRGNASRILKEKRDKISYGKSEYIKKGQDIAIISVGNMIEEALELLDLFEANDYEPTIINARFVSPIDEEMLLDLNNYKTIICLEENIYKGSFTNQIKARISLSNITFMDKCINQEIVEHGSIKQLRNKLGIDANSIFLEFMEGHQNL